MLLAKEDKEVRIFSQESGCDCLFAILVQFSLFRTHLIFLQVDLMMYDDDMMILNQMYNDTVLH